LVAPLLDRLSPFENKRAHAGAFVFLIINFLRNKDNLLRFCGNLTVTKQTQRESSRFNNSTRFMARTGSQSGELPGKTPQI
jgi:hypothetical protein